MKAKMLIITAAIAVLVSPVTSAQDEPFDPREAVKKISEGFDAVLESLNEMSTSEAQENGEEIVEDIDSLLESMKGAQDDIVNNIDELIRNQKLQSSNSSSSSGSSSQQQQKPNQSGKPQNQQNGGKQRDRNQEDGENQTPGEKDGEPKNEPGGKPGEGGEPKGQETGQKPEQGKNGRKPHEKPTEIYRQILAAGGWGYLTVAMSQRLIESNFRDWFPDYDREIRDYLKSLSGARRRR